ncbi:hypothetical protein B296_00042340 [Ensete ventricosum]|uniref:Uncharacterized protein n=1 Tax=Ensete ventricosum TaxID=4639 RepID=A0A426XW54_ENSVE|nr:hypothetical protein B296_00042340 [Ensete ventricosum]
MEGGRSLPLSRRDLAAAAAVFAIFVVGLAGLYLSMPASDYSFLKLPRTLEDIRILRFEHRIRLSLPSRFRLWFKVCSFMGLCFRRVSFGGFLI